MIRFVFVLMAAIVASLNLMAEDFRKWEGEVFAGPNVSLGSSSELDYSSAMHSKPLIGYAIGAEARYNFSSLPLDLGLQAVFSKVGHNVEWMGNGAEYWNKEYSNSISLAAIGDWTFNKGSIVAPFVGAGVGVAFNEYNWSNKAKPFFMPRAGISIHDKFRISLAAHISDAAHNSMLLSFGYSFGGFSYKKHVSEEMPTQTQKDIKKLIRQSNVCLWTGVGALCIGLPTLTWGLVIIGQPNDPVGAIIGGIITGGGGLITLASVPLFIVSHKKRRKALSLSMQMSAFSQPAAIGNISSTPAVGLALNF